MWGKIGLENQALNSNTKVGAYFASLSISRPPFFFLSRLLLHGHMRRLAYSSKQEDKLL